MLLSIAKGGGNRKLGPGVSSSARLVGPTCPRCCPLLDNGCYTQRGLIAMSQWNMRQGRQGVHVTTPEEVADAHDDKAKWSPLHRHLSAGGWVKEAKDGRKIVDREFIRGVFAWHRRPSQRFTIGFGYAHAFEQLDREFGPSTWPANFELLASIHNPRDVERMNSRGWRTARVISVPKSATLPEIKAKLKNEVLCPYDLAKHQKPNETPNVTCASCRLCLPGRKANIAFIQLGVKSV